MIWFTFFTGLIIFAIGAYCKFELHMGEWQALLPLVIGLGYLTLAEGMRSSRKSSRLFLFLAVLWSIVVLISMIPMAKEGYAVWRNDPTRLNVQATRLELIMEHAGVLLISGCYLVIAAMVLLRKPAVVTSATPVNSTKPSR